MARGACHGKFCQAATLALALAFAGQPLLAQTADRSTTGTTSPTDQGNQSPPKITPQQVIKVLDSLIKKSQVPATAPPPAPPVPAPAPQDPIPPAPAPPPTPPAPTGASTPPSPPPAAIKPATAIVRPPAPQRRDDALPSVPPPPPAVPEPVVPDPAPIEIPAPDPPQPAEPEPTTPDQPIPWAALAALLAALATIAYGLRRWFWPKLSLTCEIAVGPASLGSGSIPLIGAPELRLDLKIAVGESSAPRGTILGASS